MRWPDHGPERNESGSEQPCSGYKAERAAAVRTLGSVYATFTEGFATADLVEARDLLAAAAPIQSSAT
jgi:hypothetical protein